MILRYWPINRRVYAMSKRRYSTHETYRGYHLAATTVIVFVLCLSVHEPRGARGVMVVSAESSFSSLIPRWFTISKLAVFISLQGGYYLYF